MQEKKTLEQMAKEAPFWLNSTIVIPPQASVSTNSVIELQAIEPLADNLEIVYAMSDLYDRAPDLARDVKLRFKLNDSRAKMFSDYVPVWTIASSPKIQTGRWPQTLLLRQSTTLAWELKFLSNVNVPVGGLTIDITFIGKRLIP